MSDSANGTTAVATIAGSGGTDTNTLYKVAWSGAAGSLSFSSVGSRSGDGTISVSTAVGSWLWMLESVVAATSVKTVVVNYQPTTDGTSSGDPVLLRAMNQMKTQIVALGLTGISSSNVYIKWSARAFDTTTDPVPQIVISPAPMPEGMIQQLTGTDMLQYPVAVTIIDKLNQDYTGNISRNLKWREKISREFRYRNLDNQVSEVIYVEVEPKPQIDLNWFNKNYFGSTLVFRIHSRETRDN